MSNLQYHFDANGPGEKIGAHTHYAQTVTIGDKVLASGQGGWDMDGNSNPDDPAGQVKLAMINVERVLQEAGLRGWADVYLLRSYHAGPMADTIGPLIQAMKDNIPHRPLWTAVGVEKLGGPKMRIELEVEAIRS